MLHPRFDLVKIWVERHLAQQRWRDMMTLAPHFVVNSLVRP
jgi:hypothetical protein